MSPASPRTVEPSPSGTVIYAATAGLTTGSERLVPLLLVTAGHLISGTLCLAACITTARRVAGGLAGPLAPGGLLAVAVAGIGLILLGDRAAAGLTGQRNWLSRVSLLVMLVMLGIWYPPTDGEILITVPLLVMVTGFLVLPMKFWRLWQMQHFRHWPGLVALLQRDHEQGDFQRRQREANPFAVTWLRHRLTTWRQSRPLRTKPSTSPPQPSPESLLPQSRERGSPSFAGHLLQWQERYRLADGNEFLRGQVTVQLAAGTRLATGHVGFCPAFTATPTVEATTGYDALEVVVEAAEVLPWGVRVECRIEDAADEPVEIPIELTVRLPASSPSPSPLPSAPTDPPHGTLA
ncbi:MAG: hypothetical protein EBU59_00640 [Planctomycetia bacterium]|nr:hypothetical protein [Planctomycetia bacterium]